MTDRAPIELRTAVVADVRYPQRIIDVLAVPYDRWATVEHPPGSGRTIEEQFAPGAFGRVNRRFNVNLEHDPAQMVGRVVRLDPDDPKGLRAEIRVRQSPDGDQVLRDADDGMLDASVGFAAAPDNQQWTGTGRRRIVKAFLDHIALTWTPAYTGANVVAVRAAPIPAAVRAATPNLDRILADRLAAEYGSRL